MALKLVKNTPFTLGTTPGTETVDEYSLGDNSDQITLTVTLDNLGGSTDTNIVDAKLFASQWNYTSITVTTQTETANIDWKISSDGGSTWFDSVTPANMNALVSNQSANLKFKAVVANTGVVTTGNYITCKVKVTATENPS